MGRIFFYLEKVVVFLESLGSGLPIKSLGKSGMLQRRWPDDDDAVAVFLGRERQHILGRPFPPLLLGHGVRRPARFLPLAPLVVGCAAVGAALLGRGRLSVVGRSWAGVVTGLS